MIPAQLKDEALLRDIESAQKDASRLHLWWLGQSGFLLAFGDHRLLLDPYLSDSLTAKYAATDKPHVRLSERVLSPERLTKIDAVTSTHNHTDHLDPETLLPLLRTNPDMKLVIPESNREFVCSKLGTPASWPNGLNAGGQVEIGPFNIHAIPAAHEELTLDFLGQHHFLGYVIQCDGWTLYHSGDTIRYAQMEQWLDPWDIDVALLPINGRLPERRVSGNLWGREAAQLGWDIGAGLTVPCHFDMFEFNTVSPDDFTRECAALNCAHKVLKHGERLSLNPQKGSCTGE